MKTFNVSLTELLSQGFLEAWGQLTTTNQTKKSPIIAWVYCIPNNAVLDHDRVKASSIPLSDANLAEISPENGMVAKPDFQTRSQQLGMALEGLANQQQQGLILKSAWGFSAPEINRQLDKPKNIGRHFEGKWNPWIYRHPPPSNENR